MTPRRIYLVHLLLAALAVTSSPGHPQVAASAAMASMTESIVSGMERGTDSLRRSLAELNNTANSALSIAEDKVRNEYIPGLSNTWRWAVGYALWLNPEVPSSQCPEDPVVTRLLHEVEAEALACVRDKVPRSVPDVRNSVNQVLFEIEAYMQRVRRQGEECDEESGLQGVLCKATRLAPLGGYIGLLSGSVGRVSGEIGILVDGNARHCTITSAQTREAAALSASHNTSECIKAAGSNAGNYELARIYSSQRPQRALGLGGGGTSVTIINGVRLP